STAPCSRPRFPIRPGRARPPPHRAAESRCAPAADRSTAAGTAAVWTVSGSSFFQYHGAGSREPDHRAVDVDCLRIRRELTMLGIERDLQVLAQRAGAHRGCGVAEVHRAARLEPRDHPEGLAVLAPPDDDALVVGGHGGPAWLVAAGEGR